MKVPEEDDRFGVPPELIRQLLEEHRGLIRMGCYVPTKREVATADPARLEVVLSDWFWESPEAIIPTYRQVQDVLAILRARADAGSEAIQRIIAQAPTDADFG
jgi:hypothetical protein